MSNHDDERDEERGRSSLSEGIRRALASGVSAVGDLKNPKEALAYLAQQTERSRKELFSLFTQEIKGFLGELDIAGEVRKSLVGLRLEVNADVRFTEDEQVAHRVTVRKKKGKSDA
jgi:hypothetical protein